MPAYYYVTVSNMRRLMDTLRIAYEKDLFNYSLPHTSTSAFCIARFLVS